MVIAKRYRVSFRGDENVLKVIVVMVSKPNILKPMILHTLHGLVVRCVNYISI